MQRIYLVRHASPVIQPNVDAAQWPLSPRGIAEAQRLAEEARRWNIAAVYTSSEQKARSTGLLLAEPMGLPVHVTEGFEELRFDQWIGNSDEFSEAVRNILEHPEISFRGAERADAAASRFAAGVEIARQGPLPAAIVSHGRIMTAYLARESALVDPGAFWRAMPLPGWCEIEFDGGAVTLASGFHALREV